MTTTPTSSAAPARRTISRRRKWLFSGLIALVTYGVVETTLTWLYLRGTLDPELLWVIEQVNEKGHITSDDVLGYRLSATPARTASITTRGVIEEIGELRGNNFGFPDRDDYPVEKARPEQTRLLVLGDSFTASPYLQVNWPDRCEELATERGQDIQLINGSLYGGGLSNWWSVVTRFVVEKELEIDGVVFVVFVNDLDRKFEICDDAYHREVADPRSQLACGYSDSFDPETYGDIRVQFLSRSFVVTPEVFDQLAAGEWRPDYRRDFKLYVLGTAVRSIGSWFPESTSSPEMPATARDWFLDEQLVLIDEMAQVFRERKLPVAVVHFPIGSDIGKAQALASLLGARYLNALDSFAGLSEDERQAYFMSDGHWNQKGSDRFADWMLQQIGGSPP
ncbi:MAG: SGNH/GDSL hydrolase family protein [Planctomycetota bacterium]|nr:MAG: SGNH/GDSL hydrolase family protein [Planctomycetota bacterium]REJ97369.1 MAG: SGNH/GDSL hydrolase family protein [Planctomycetota bacterium]REK27720.1 MAG: SGNH/GDSL hydrolase family protein [Planctomycetota bacterium]REK38438.1 MAG: SGNH/GDSL hydrolase family protein [Planctomycetota bacterium]